MAVGPRCAGAEGSEPPGAGPWYARYERYGAERYTTIFGET
jgi:hypothetical protein